jgi:L-lactate dehydrogenase (cytochrome)
VKGDIAILADSGIRNGLDVVRMIALGADSVLLGRAYLTRWRPTARRAWQIC